MNKTVLNFLFVMLCVNPIYAKVWGGFISEKHISGYTYQVSITTFVVPSSAQDVQGMVIYYGDGSSEIITRLNNGAIMENNIKKSVYIGTHTYSGIGLYTLTTNGTTRTAGIMNISNSIDADFYLESNIYVFDPFTDCVSNGIDFDRMPISTITTGNKYRSDLPLIFTDNDSLSFSIVPCMIGGTPIFGYYIPSGFVINPKTGQLKWDNPAPSYGGTWDFAIKAEKWRKGILVGSTLFDFLLTVNADTTAPFNFNLSEPCIVDIDSNYICTVNSGEPVNISISYTNSNIQEYSELNYLQNPCNVVSTTDSIYFTWIPDNANARKYPYKITFRGTQLESGNLIYRDYTYLINVLGMLIDSCPSPPILQIGENLSKEKRLINYPNPAMNQITIELTGISKDVLLEIKNMLGETVCSEQLRQQTTKAISIDVSMFATGVYFLQVQSDGDVLSKKFVKQ